MPSDAVLSQLITDHCSKGIETLIVLPFYFSPDHLSMGHRGRSKGREDCGCQDHLHRPHSSGGRCFLAPASWIFVWLSGWRPETHDVSGWYKWVVCCLVLSMETRLLLYFQPNKWCPCCLLHQMGHSVQHHVQSQPLSRCSHCWGQLSELQPLQRVHSCHWFCW